MKKYEYTDWIVVSLYFLFAGYLIAGIWFYVLCFMINWEYVEKNKLRLDKDFDGSCPCASFSIEGIKIDVCIAGELLIIVIVDTQVCIFMEKVI
jgi:hypothetical protein